jgi:environmental stress-induced protein Ves
MNGPRLIDPMSYRRMPWKNGLGSTLELATDATTNAAVGGSPWTWRLSIGDVPVRAAFSAFPGIDRHIACLDGAGLELRRGVERIAIAREGTAFAFAGEDTLEGDPIGAGVRDANLMLDRRVWRGEFTIVRNGAAMPAQINADLVVMFAAQCAHPLECRANGQPILLRPSETLVCPERVEIDFGSEASTLVIARILRTR